MPGISRIVADNPSLMTYRGTNIYLVEGNGSFGLLDPRPDDDGHPSDILDATGRCRSVLSFWPYRQERPEQKDAANYQKSALRSL